MAKNMEEVRRRKLQAENLEIEPWYYYDGRPFWQQSEKEKRFWAAYNWAFSFKNMFKIMSMMILGGFGLLLLSPFIAMAIGGFLQWIGFGS